MYYNLGLVSDLLSHLTSSQLDDQHHFKYFHIYGVPHRLLACGHSAQQINQRLVKQPNITFDQTLLDGDFSNVKIFKMALTIKSL